MFRLLAILGAGALSAVGSAQAVLFYEAHAPRPQPESAQVATAPPAAAVPVTFPQPAPSERGPSIPKAADGHYWAEAKVNGSPVKFLVDTGASAVALSAADADRLGFNPAGLDYGYTVITASGEARAAKITLASVNVGGARVSDVDAFVIEKGLETSLLGMTYLGRLSGFEATSTRLVLKP